MHLSQTAPNHCVEVESSFGALYFLSRAGKSRKVVQMLSKVLGKIRLYTDDIRGWCY